MKKIAMAIAGIGLLLPGAVAFHHGGIPYTSREQVVKVGPFEATSESKRSYPIHPVVSASAVLGGIVLLVRAVKK